MSSKAPSIAQEAFKRVTTIQSTSRQSGGHRSDSRALQQAQELLVDRMIPVVYTGGTCQSGQESSFCVLQCFSDGLTETQHLNHHTGWPVF